MVFFENGLRAEPHQGLPGLETGDSHKRLRGAEDQGEVAEILQSKRTGKDGEIKEAADRAEPLATENPGQVAQDIGQPVTSFCGF